MRRPSWVNSMSLSKGCGYWMVSPRPVMKLRGMALRLLCQGFQPWKPRVL